MLPSGNSPTTSGVNLWLAIGDETGPFDNPQSPKLHGAGLILARPAALAAALNENLKGRSIRQRMDAPIEGLENWLRAQGAAKKEELHRHHVREAWCYLNERGIKGQFALDATPSDPVLAHLLAAFRWLAGHPEIISLGIYGTGKEVMTDFWKGSDPMAAIGAIYGRSLALIKPFLGPAPRIRVLPGRRSEAVNSPAILRAGQAVPESSYETNRQSSSRTGGNRALLETMESEFWKTLAVMNDPLATSANTSTRQITFSGYMSKKEAIAQLKKDDGVAAMLVDQQEHRLNTLADLACSLMAASGDTAARDLRLQFPTPIGPNVRFFSVKEVLP